MASFAEASAYEDCERQLLELEAVACIFDQEFAHGNPEAHALVSATFESCQEETTFSWDRLQELRAVVHLPHCSISFTLPHGYPSSEAVRCSVDASPGDSKSL